MKSTRSQILCALFAALTAIGAFLRVPVGYTSFTLQVFFTLMAGVLLGPYYGALSQLIYVLLGLSGIPVFTEGGGLSYLWKPGFGFLLGLILAAFVTGWLTRRMGSSFGKLLLAGIAGIAAMYLVALPYLYWILNSYLGAAMSVKDVLLLYCLRFLPFDGVKAVCAAVLGRQLLPRISPIRTS